MAERKETARKKKYKIVVIDDHPIVRHGLRELINSDSNYVVCGEAEDSESGWNLIKKHKPDLAIIDISLKDSNGIDFIKAVLRRIPDFLILVISMHDENMYGERALRAGARGYIMKQVATDKVLEGIREILNGELYISEELSARMINKLIGNRRKDNQSIISVDRLSDRELEVFRYIGSGFSVKEIAGKMNLSVKTIETYRQNTKIKLKLGSSSELNRFAIQWVNQFTE